MEPWQGPATCSRLLMKIGWAGSEILWLQVDIGAVLKVTAYITPGRWRIHNTNNNTKGCEPGEWIKCFGWERACVNSHHLFESPPGRVAGAATHLWPRCWRRFWLLITCIDEAVGPCNTGSPLSPGRSASVCDLIDPRLPRPEAWWRDLQLLASVAHNMNSGLALWPPSEAGERKPLSVYSHWIKLGRKLLLLSRRFLTAVCLQFFFAVLLYVVASKPLFTSMARGQKQDQMSGSLAFNREKYYFYHPFYLN